MLCADANPHLRERARTALRRPSTSPRTGPNAPRDKEDYGHYFNTFSGSDFYFNNRLNLILLTVAMLATFAQMNGPAIAEKRPTMPYSP